MQMEEIEKWTYEDVSVVHLCLFRVIGILPINGDVEFSNFRILLRNHLPSIYGHIIILLFYTMYLGHGIRLALEGGLDVEYICEIVVVHGVFFRYLILYHQRNQLLSLVELCEELWLYLGAGEGKTVRNFERIVYYLRNIFLFNGMIAATFYIVTGLFSKMPPANVNDTAKRVLPIKFYVDVQDDFWYFTVTIIQSIVCYSIAVILVGIETVGPFLIIIACGYLRVIQYRFLTMTNIPNDNGLIEKYPMYTERLPVFQVLRCVKFHQMIMKFCHKIEQFTCSLFMVQVGCTIYNISLLCINLLEINQNKLKHISILILNIVQFFTCQWISEYLVNESEAISRAAYTVTLTHPIYEREANKMLLMIIQRAQRPVQLTAGGVINLSLETFEHMCINAFSFFTVLRSFSD